MIIYGWFANMNKQCPNCSQAMEEGESTIEGTPLFFLFYGMSRMFLFFRGASYFVAWAVPIYGETNNAVFNQAHLTSITIILFQPP